MPGSYAGLQGYLGQDYIITDNAYDHQIRCNEYNMIDMQ